MKYGQLIIGQAQHLAGITETPGMVTRTYLTTQHRRAGEYVIGLMQAAGMTAGFDPLGNVVGRYEAADTGAPTLIMGSHLDTVRNAGRYDGIFGVLSAIACVGALHGQGRRLPVAIEVVGFGDEEGVRFGLALLGSKAMAGQFDPAWLDLTDADGITVRQALSHYGVDPEDWRSVNRQGKNVVAYLESHIEQGPVLLNEGLPVGVVTAIAGATRSRINVTGLAGHAGTVPMAGRQDALTAAAEMMLAVESYCLSIAGLVGTVGKVDVKPGAVNVIPQDVEFTIDVRSGDDAVRARAMAHLQQVFAEIAARRHVTVQVARFHDADAAPCHPIVQQLFADAIDEAGVGPRRLASGAGHDAMVFPSLCPTGMLFVRCGNGGISHHPDEILSAEDAELATAILFSALERFDPKQLVGA